MDKILIGVIIKCAMPAVIVGLRNDLRRDIDMGAFETAGGELQLAQKLHLALTQYINDKLAGEWPVNDGIEALIKHERSL